MTTDDFTEAARAEAERRHPAPEIETGAQLGYTQTQIREVVRRTFTGAAEWARTHLAEQEPTDAESLLDTDAGLALANAAWKEGASTMLRSVNGHEDGPWEKPGSPYSAPLLGRIAARRDEEKR